MSSSLRWSAAWLTDLVERRLAASHAGVASEDDLKKASPLELVNRSRLRVDLASFENLDDELAESVILLPDEPVPDVLHLLEPRRGPTRVAAPSVSTPDWKAVTTLEDATRTTRRVLGGAHPLVAEIGDSLREARAALHSSEAPP